MDAHSNVQDFVLSLPELHGKHSGVNIAGVVATTLTNFGVDKDSVGYFVLENAYNNDIAVASLADRYGFETPGRRLRCCCHILKLSAQVIIWGKDREEYENDGENLEVSALDPSFKQYTNSFVDLLLPLLHLLYHHWAAMPCHAWRTAAGRRRRRRRRSRTSLAPRLTSDRMRSNS
jgi:hypothetical protein